jgi:8-oxo-dGTP pyrophosphatase MutT (NUDIX family)
MPHIHTEPGQIDFVANVFIVHNNRVLYRLHDKRKIWLMPGGHVELNEVPEQTAVREAFEEVGLEVKLYNPHNMPLVGRLEDSEKILLDKEGNRELLPPYAMEIHNYSDTHRHIGLIYFATASTDEVIEPAGKEKSGGCIWLTKEEIVKHEGLSESMKNYGLKALALLGE